MKKTVTKRVLWLTALIIVVSCGLTSCDPDDDDWYWGTPPYGWSFQDNRLTGYWQLVQYNSDPVYINDANYMYFNGNGGGLFYYLDNGYEMVENMRYYCQDAVNGASNYQINIQYQYSQPLTTNYWFTHGNNTLWMQWQTSGGRVQTYVYDRVRMAPW